MDSQTLAAYQRGVAPGPVHRLATGFFWPGAPTADIGCGAGRDAAWLDAHGFPSVGYEPSAAMRAAALPDLDGVPDQAYANVLCSAVLMHLPATDLIGAAVALARILRPGGRLVLSFRGPRGTAEREPDGRLFTHIEPGRLVLLLERVGLAVLHRETTPDTTRPDVCWHVLVAACGPLEIVCKQEHGICSNVAA